MRTKRRSRPTHHYHEQSGGTLVGEQGGEHRHFARNYSCNQFDPLYVGSSLVPELGGEEPDSWTSQAQQHSTQRVRAAATGAEHDPGSTLARLTTPRAEEYFENEDPSIKEGDPAGPDEYKEMDQAALLLQAIAQNYDGRWALSLPPVSVALVWTNMENDTTGKSYRRSVGSVTLPGDVQASVIGVLPLLRLK